MRTPATIVCLLTSTLVSAQTAPPQVGQPQPARAVTVTGIPGVVAAGAQWTVAWQGTDNADGLVGTRDGSLLFAQEQPNRVSKLDTDDRMTVYAENTGGAGALAIDTRGRLVAVQRTCTDPGRRGPCTEPTAVAIIFPEKERKQLATSVQGMPLGRINDLVVGRHGDVYFTSGGAYFLSRTGQVTSIGENLRTNGIMLSRDEKTLYVTNGMVVVAFDVRPDGTVANQRDFATLEAGGTGDGMAIDGNGRLYVTSQPGVQVFSTDGKYLGLIPTPRTVISAAFAGPDKKTLYVVGSGAVDPTGREVTTLPGVRNNAKTIFRIPLGAAGFKGRPK
jgi:gluconolactonase